MAGLSDPAEGAVFLRSQELAGSIDGNEVAPPLVET